ncbi:hypothetical protein HPB49_002733 [Dermacentor silvarum]|uniref:Uncharacterized protein n=1 Tax=Dermacentor silvarum TaxID=543639 RepID=A0ACB8DAE2_DERSI|nr:hypothetical protein HPB49_002733 [Dermacentor silvarum]
MSDNEFRQMLPVLTVKQQAATYTNGLYVFSAKCSRKVLSDGLICPECKSHRKLLLTRKSCQKAHVPKKGALAQRLKLQRQKTKRLKNSATALKNQLKAMSAKNKAITEEQFTSRIAALPPKQREATLHMFKSASRKSAKGMRYSNEWVLECLIMKMKSAKLYEHLRKENILSLPSKTTLRKYLKSYRTGFGFSPKIFNVVSEKTATMEEYACHGGIIVDEMHLSEHLSVTTAGHIDGFVDLGNFKSPKDKHTPCDHGMVLIFVPFIGKWTQILAAFATRGNVNGGTLTKIMLEAILLAEKAGLKVDFITSDGASWNRRMWTLMGVKASLNEIKCSAPHPVDEHRQLYFISDFPHLLKCLRNRLVCLDFQTPNGQVTMRAIRKALELDGRKVTLQAMHGITSSHTNPNNFEKMRVGLAVQLFSEKVTHGLQLHKARLEDLCGSIAATIHFFE